MELPKQRRCLVCNQAARNGKLFCSSYCRVINNSRVYHYTNRDKAEYQKNRKRHMKMWYETHKEHQKANVLRNYYQNKDKWRMRTFNSMYRQEILKYLSPNCSICGVEGIKFLSMNSYDKKPPRLKGLPEQKRAEAFVEYIRDHLVGVCSLACKGKRRWRAFEDSNFVKGENK